MVPELSDRAKSLLERAVALENSEREAFLDGECRDDPLLRAELADLLVHYDDAVEAGFLDSDLLPAGAAPARHRIFEEGDVASSRFRIVRFLGSGGYGEVYAAEDNEFPDHPVALKTLRAEVASNRSAVRRFRREIQLARAITHPNVCRIFDIHRHQDDARSVTFFTMTLLVGETLSDRLFRLGRLDESEALSILRPICAGLAAVHRAGVIHRDLKCSNVILERKNDGVEPVITDFGLALLSPRRKDGSVLSSTGRYLGTPAYMAPEQIAGGDFSEATDVYALGVVCYEMLTGKLPFDGRDPREVAEKRLYEPPRRPREFLPTIDRRWESVILKCLEREPSARFSTPLQLVEALSEGSEDSTPERIGRIGPLPAMDDEPTPEPARAPLVSWLVGLAGGLLTVLLLGLVSHSVFDAALGVPRELGSGSLLSSFTLGLRFLIPLTGSAVYDGLLLAALYLLVKTLGFLFRGTYRSLRRRLAGVRAFVDSLEPATLAVVSVVSSFGLLLLVQSLYGNLLRTIIRMTNGRATISDTKILCDVFEPYHQTHTLVFTLLLALLGTALVAFRRLARRRRYPAGAKRLGTLGIACALAVGLLLLVVPYRILWQNDSERVRYDGERAFIVARSPSRFALFFPAHPGRRGVTSKADDPRLQRSGEWADIFECQ